MFCARCGRSVQEGASFCWNCGLALSPGSRVPGPAVAPAMPSVPAPATPAPATTLAPSSAWRAFEAARPAVASMPTAAIPASAPMPPSFGTHAAGNFGGRGPSVAASPTPAGDAATEVTPAEVSVAWIEHFNGKALPRERLAGFWRRTLAAILDSILLTILLSPAYLLWVYPAAIKLEGQDASEIDPTAALGFLLGFLAFYLLSALVTWAYFGFLESSAYQASLGKMALGIRVTDQDGRRLSLAKATTRRVARMLTDFTLGIGYLMVVWTARRQALHDKMVSTLVVRS